MITTLAFRHLLVKKFRSLFLLLGFSIGVGVMVVLLSVGEAMLDQSRDVALVGGGEVTVLPQGIDVEALRTGGLGAMFFGIERARFLTRQAIGGERHAAVVRTVAPAIEGKLLYLCPAAGECRPTAVRASGEIPSRASALGAGVRLLEGRWIDSPADSAYVSPTAQQLYDEMDRFHLPVTRDSTWGEWHYFNLVTGPDEWWYVTFLIGGEVSLTGPGSRWGGRMLLTHRRPDGRHDRYTFDAPSASVAFDTARADVAIGESFVQQRDGHYRLRAEGRSGGKRARLDLIVDPEPHRYFPPVELRDDEFRSGYVVPALAASATGRICVADRCAEVAGVPAYHDHNWGVWRDVTWEWGAARGTRLGLLYGGVYGPDRATTSPFFLTVVDSLGVRRVLRFRTIDYEGSRPADGVLGGRAPERFSLTGTWEADTVTLSVEVDHALATEMDVGTFRRHFIQMRGRFRLSGRIMGEPLSDRGEGFFETYLTQ
ncbi:MAG TPA: hypothetical protein VFR72_07725 [Gemmatimonadales bacterium]|nr:hypothetical protein [Gemmatimonadales bacterium]